MTRPPVHLNRTVLLVGEGQHELALLKHLKHRLAPRKSGVSVTIRCANGGDALHAVETAERVQAGFDVVYVVVDNDRGDSGQIEKAKRRAASAGIRIIWSEPNLEHELLRGRGLPVGAGNPKRQVQSLLGGDPSREDSYHRYFAAEPFETIVGRSRMLSEVAQALSLHT